MVLFFAPSPQVFHEGGGAKKKRFAFGANLSVVYLCVHNITGSPARGKNDDDGCVRGCSWTQI
jgi:hypothetical protein